MTTDRTFFTNEPGNTLLQRFGALLKNVEHFDALVGYLYSSGFASLAPHLAETDHIRVLVGIATDHHVFSAVQRAAHQQELPLSTDEQKAEYLNESRHEIDHAPETVSVEQGLRTIIDWLLSGKLEIRGYPSTLHAKVYILSYRKGDKDTGRVITGSSNFTTPGLVENLEFNVELKGVADHEFARQKFNEMWKQSIPLSEDFVAMLKENTWLNDTITPRELYLKFLAEYFRRELRESEIKSDGLPDKYRKLRYQFEAVQQARHILEEYNGVFLADVVGLGKTWMAALLMKQLGCRALIIAPPPLLSTWEDVCGFFRLIAPTCRSSGDLERIRDDGTSGYEAVVIDESHRFRNGNTQTYGILSEICRGKKVILLSATPFNNRPLDLLHQIALFQPKNASDIPGFPNIEDFFRRKDDEFQERKHRRQSTHDIGEQMREKILRHVMVRRTRADLQAFYADDLSAQGLTLPPPSPPVPLYYQLDDNLDHLFQETVSTFAKQMLFARYRVLTRQYWKNAESEEEQAYTNLASIMKTLFIKRLESSFHAFRTTLERAVTSHEQFLEAWKKGAVLVGKRRAPRLAELLDETDDEQLQEILDESETVPFDAKEFSPALGADVKADFDLLLSLAKRWREVIFDPKTKCLVQAFENDKLLSRKDGKRPRIIIFTESTDTALHLSDILRSRKERVLTFSGSDSAKTRSIVKSNFDPDARHLSDDYDVLVTTDVLSEGVNLHRANILIHYDIPWNPTRMMQRAGRINRIGTAFDHIYTYTFLPTKQAEDEIHLKRYAEQKIEAFIHALGADSPTLTDSEPVTSHTLFRRLTEEAPDEGEAPQSELKYLAEIRGVRDEDPKLFARLQRLPRKARTGRDATKHALVTYVRRGNLDKFYRAQTKADVHELTFLETAGVLHADVSERIKKVDPTMYYPLIEKTMEAFEIAESEELSMEARAKKRGRKSAEFRLQQVLRTTEMKAHPWTDEDCEFLEKVRESLAEGLPLAVSKGCWEACSAAKDAPTILSALRRTFPEAFLSLRSARKDRRKEQREIILSCLFTING